MSMSFRLRCTFRRPALLVFIIVGFCLHWSLSHLFSRDVKEAVEQIQRSTLISRNLNLVTPAQPPQQRSESEVGQDDTQQEDPDEMLRAMIRADFLAKQKDVPRPQQLPLLQEGRVLGESCLALSHACEFLPDVIFIPIEEAVAGETLQGWEDEWVSEGVFDAARWGHLDEPKIDIVYSWVNGSEEAFRASKLPYELASPLNDDEGVWMGTHGMNRYRDWDELRYSLRSIANNAVSFTNKIQILVNGLGSYGGKQQPQWLQDQAHQDARAHTVPVEVLSQEDFFDQDKHVCLPTFNSLTIENQIFNTPSEVDHMFAMSDDMLLATEHAASDIYSPLLGPALGFKANAYNVKGAPNLDDVHRFGEKPFLIYTSWLLNRRFGERKRHGQVHFGHSVSRRIAREAVGSFPRPAQKSATRRFRGEPGPAGELGLQLYSWYLFYHYTVERHREALLKSYIVHRSDTDGDGMLSWSERRQLLDELEDGMAYEGAGRTQQYHDIDNIHVNAGLKPPQARSVTLWTSIDGPLAIKDLECPEFNVDECLAPGFSMQSGEAADKRNPHFTTAAIWDRLARQQPNCGDCLMKILLNRVERGLDPLLPHANSQVEARQMIVKALMRYKYSIVEPNGWFQMITDADQVETQLTTPLVLDDGPDRPVVGQLCLNDDVLTSDETELNRLQAAMHGLFSGLFPNVSPWEK